MEISTLLVSKLAFGMFWQIYKITNTNTNTKKDDLVMFAGAQYIEQTQLGAKVLWATQD